MHGPLGASRALKGRPVLWSSPVLLPEMPAGWLGGTTCWHPGLDYPDGPIFEDRIA